MIRPSSAAVIWPKAGVAKVPLGLLKRAWLSTLKASTRAWMRWRPAKSKFLKIDMSVRWKPGPRTVLRPALPGRTPESASEVMLRSYRKGFGIDEVERAVEAVRAAGGTVVGVLAVVDREEGGRETIQDSWKRPQKPRCDDVTEASASGAELARGNSIIGATSSRKGVAGCD